MSTESKIRNRITSALRAISRSWKPRALAKNKAKVGPATYECSSCKIWVYEGASKRSVEEICSNMEKQVIMSKIHMDHVSPVVPLEGWKDWDHFSTSIIGRMFCPEENWNPLCEECHAKKTNSEKDLRKSHRKKKKAEEKAKPSN